MSGRIIRAGSRTGIRGGVLLSMLLLAAGLGSVSPLAGQSSGSWAPWLGCWEPAPGFAGPELCIGETGEGVELLTLAGEDVVDTRTLVAGGVPRAVSEEECSGTETARFSGDGNRVYVRSTVVCDGVEQSASGILAMITPFEWVDVNVVTIDGRTATWVQRYVADGTGAGELAEMTPAAASRSLLLRRARIAALASPEVDQVIEASAEVDAGAVEAWLAEVGAPLELDAQRLLRMADAGVPESVIDVVVAVSNPNHFVVEGAALGASGAITERVATGNARSSYGGPYAAVLYGGSSYYSPYGGYYGYGVSPYGWSPGWGWAPGYSYRPTVVIVDRQDSARGQRVKGAGYRSGGSRESEGASNPRVPDMGPQRRDTGSSGASSSPPSSGSNPPSTGRTAKPRPPGGDE